MSSMHEEFQRPVTDRHLIGTFDVYTTVLNFSKAASPNAAFVNGRNYRKYEFTTSKYRSVHLPTGIY